MSGFSRSKLEAGKNGLGLTYVQLESSPKVVAVCFQGLARRSRGELEGVLYKDHMRFHSCHRASSLLIAQTTFLGSSPSERR